MFAFRRIAVTRRRNTALSSTSFSLISWPRQVRWSPISVDAQTSAVVRTRDESRGSDVVSRPGGIMAVSYTHLRAHETGRNLVCRLLLEKKKKKKQYVN